MSLSHRMLSRLSARWVRILARRVAERPESHLRSAKLARLEEWLPATELAFVLAEAAQ